MTSASDTNPKRQHPIAQPGAAHQVPQAAGLNHNRKKEAIAQASAVVGNRVADPLPPVQPKAERAVQSAKPVQQPQTPVAETPTLQSKTPIAPKTPQPERRTEKPFGNTAPTGSGHGSAAVSKPSQSPPAPTANQKPPHAGPVRGGQGAAGMKNDAANKGRRMIPRPESWEDDISRNTLDDTPFTSLPSPASRAVADFENASRYRRIVPLLGESSIGHLLKKDAWPIPTAEDREGYSAGFDENYWLSGLEDYLKIMKIAKRHRVVPKTVLDFGCATGRVVRHFAAQSEIPEVWATDINQRHIRWLYEHLPHNVKPVFNHCIPTLPVADHSVDIVTAFSVFTHIDTFETHWLAELSRIMSADGMCYFTVHNEDTWEALRKEIDNENNRLIKSIVKIDPDFKQVLMEPMPDQRTIYRFTQSGPYRAQVFHSNNYLRKVWGRFFDIEAIMPCHHVRQTVVVLRKKSR